MTLSSLLLCATAVFASDGRSPILAVGEEGLWRIVLDDGRVVSAASCENTHAPRVFRKGRTVCTEWKSPDAEVYVLQIPCSDGYELEMTVRPLTGDLIDVALPARLRFEAQDVDRLTMPQHGSQGPGVAFNRKFFSHLPHYQYEEAYPNAFADYLHLKTSDGATCAVFGVQPRWPHEPWRGKDLFVRGAVGCGTDELGPWARHRFVAYVKKGETRRLPRVRVLTGKTNREALDAYALANNLTRTLEQKASVDRLAKLKESPLLLVRGSTCAQCRAMVGDLPVPTLFHLTQYLRGGFDKQYPDHLPPNETRFGDGAEFRSLVDDLHESGHLFSPYTNPTWWCDDPKGPTFAAAGTDALRLDKDLQPIKETYGANWGWSTTLWHPSVRAANVETRRAFLEDYPCDLLFQDQCGNRTGGGFDYNPASPSPDAYLEGVLSMLEEDSAKAALGTEDGWDQCANLEAAVFGLCWRTVPCETIPASHAESFKRRFDPSTWEMSPVAQYLMHGKTLFWMHDLGQFVTNERVLAWMLALGYNLSYSITADEWQRDAVARDWFRWLADLQKHVVAKYADRPLSRFGHRRTSLFDRTDIDPVVMTDDGVVVAQYDDIVVAVNLGDVPRMVGKETLAPYGFSISGEGVRAAALAGERPFMMIDGKRREWTAGFATDDVDASRKAVSSVALVRLPKDVEPAWVAAEPGDWAKTLSEIADRNGISYSEVHSYEELSELLSAGPLRCNLIVNPYGEVFPAATSDGWRDSLAAIRHYVERGGSWLEAGGYSFSFVAWNDSGKWQRREIGTVGAAELGVRILSGELQDSPRALFLTDAGRSFLGTVGESAFAKAEARTNRALSEMPGTKVVPLIRDESGRIWVGWHPMGEGRLYRFGGTYPPKEFVLRAVELMLTGKTN